MYVTFFGLMMTCLECNIGNLAPKFKKNFGFLFSFAGASGCSRARPPAALAAPRCSTPRARARPLAPGRTLYIIFCATMCYAFNNWLGWVVGSLTMLNGLFNGYVICVHPAFKTGELTAMGDPYGGYTGGEAEMLEYLKKNPQLAASAGSAAVSFARDNPDVAASAMQGAASAQGGGGGSSNPWGGR